MADTKNLYETIGEKAYRLRLPFPEIPDYISGNLKYGLFDWQTKALENFLTFESIKQKENLNQPTHLMFNMATGTGKTLLMASTILYYYNQGYRHFLFFVNQNNIVDKTENNFVDNTHTKYLFKEKIVIDDKTVNIKKVDTFGDNPEGIEIKFTSIQKLYNDIHLTKENQTTLADLQSKNIVMLADEAHHLNANTSKKKGEQEDLDLITELKGNVVEIEKKGWEDTVMKLILGGKKENNQNVLLEFTATIPENEQVAKKYEDKIISKFGLKEFLQAGYTKEINLISSTLGKKERVFQALLFGWYRHKIALKHKIANFKPVVLFRSKTIDESKTDYEEFLNWVDSISSTDFDFLQDIKNNIAVSQDLNEQGKSRTEQLLKFITKEGINFGEIANWIKQNYQEKNTIITNSKTNKTQKEKTDEETEKLLNNLEDKNNHIRAIFTVDRLTEGWDVLNLFDIVRLYQGQNAGGTDKKANKTPESTTKEKQLIGRGVRYFSFEYADKIKNKRKFDDDLNHELRVLEELFYYTFDEDSRYISHLKDELKKDGYIQDDRIAKTFALKQEFLETDFYKNTKIWHNKQIDNPNRKKKTLANIKKSLFSYKIRDLQLTEQEVNFGNKEDLQRLALKEKGLQTISKKFKEIEKHIIQKALNVKAKQEDSLFQFDKLKIELDIESIDDLWKDEFLGDFEIRIVSGVSYDDIKNSEKLAMVTKFLDYVFAELKSKIAPKIGSQEFYFASFEKVFGQPKTKTIQANSEDGSVVNENNWYILDGFVGTTLEKDLIQFIKETIGNLESKYQEIYLLRNEEVYKIYDFEQGRGFMPDFILFLKDANLQYQIFIEPKGEHLIAVDQWKEDFLKQITQKYSFDKIIQAENPNYRLIGLPFFNEKNNTDFNTEYSKIL